MAVATGRTGRGRLALDRQVLAQLKPRSEYEVAARLAPREAKALTAAFLKGQTGGTYDWAANASSVEKLAAGRLLSRRDGSWRLTRLGRATARALATGFLPHEDMPTPRLSSLRDRIYGERAYRVRHRGRVVTSNCQPSRRFGDKSIRLHLVEMGDFELDEGLGKEERFVYQDGKGSRLLRERIESVLPLFDGVPSRILHPLLYDKRSESLVLACFVDGNTVYLRADNKYVAYLHSRFGDLRFFANLAELRAADGGDTIAVACSSGERLDALLFDHVRVVEDPRRLEEALADAYDTED